MNKSSNQNKDLTPHDFKISAVSKLEVVKKIVRRLGYPVYTLINHYILRYRFGSVINHDIDKLFLGHRGSDYDALRRKVNSYSQIKGRDILVIGCGTGKDLGSWLKYEPRKLVAVDLFSYDRAWNLIKVKYRELYPSVDIQFIQQDLNKLNITETFDFVVSDAVFEHLRDFDLSISNVVNVLKTDGILYATFGPLWYCWGGDHIGGKLEHGYNHLLLDDDAYQKHLKNRGEFMHDEGDGRTWIFNDLFSYLKSSEYMEKLSAVHLKKEYVSAMIEKRALNFKKTFPEKFDELTEKVNEEDLIITGMTTIYRKK